MSRITHDRGNGRRSNMVGIGNDLTFGGDPVPNTDSISLNHCGIGRRFIRISHTVTGRFFTNPIWERSSRHSDPD